MLALTLLLPGSCQIAEKVLLLHYNPSLLKARILQFPTDKSLGSVSIDPLHNGVLMDRRIKIQAKGTIKVPAGSMVTLVVEYPLLSNPALLKTIPADGIDRLQGTKLPVELPEDAGMSRVISGLSRFTGLQSVDLNYSDCTDDGVTKLSGMKELRSLSLAQSQCNGSFLRNLSGVDNLEQLDLSWNNIDTNNLKYLSRFPKLRIIILDHLRLGDDGLKAIAMDKNITCLNLSNNKDISDKNIALLKGLRKLTWLRLTNTRVTLPGLLQLKGLPLETIVLRNTIYKKPDVDALKAAFPRAKLGLEGPKTIDSIDQTLLSPMH